MTSTAPRVPAGAVAAMEVPLLTVNEERLATTVLPDHCPVCAQTMPLGGTPGRARRYCTDWCARRAPGLRRRGWLPDRLPDLVVAV
ncbi:hypothetical protein [Kitasatospora griseola]|uniref:hypothetical protein n=1 Tax=Kitasatospora griseola TaxID=2064 RepID=UPI0037F82C15